MPRPATTTWNWSAWWKCGFQRPGDSPKVDEGDRLRLRFAVVEPDATCLKSAQLAEPARQRHRRARIWLVISVAFLRHNRLSRISAEAANKRIRRRRRGDLRRIVAGSSR